ncbi:MAG: M67 family metallopeptidase [Thermodesulfobacteriota bacterium]|jgi:proteasome lid subunit RPN8/RPN11
MIYINEQLYTEIKDHAMDVYPSEGCGVLVGTGDRVLKIYRVENINKERANDRYEIDPSDILRIEKEASNESQDIIGFYHSHPDHPDMPSDFDRERAWPDYRYIIISVRNGTEVSIRSWKLVDNREKFEEERLMIEG